jgi:hypothetical protein
MSVLPSERKGLAYEAKADHFILVGENGRVVSRSGVTNCDQAMRG